MTQQKSENPIEPEGLRKLAQTVDYRRGGEGVPVNQVDEQFELRFATADAQDGSSQGKTEGFPSPSGSRRAPKAKIKGEAWHPATIMDAPAQGSCGDRLRSRTGRRRG